MADIARAWQELADRVRRIETFQEVRSLAEWDQLTMMPPRAAEARGEQAALLASLQHHMMTDPALGDLLATLEAEPTDDPARRAGLVNLRRVWDRANRMPAHLVEALERARSRGLAAWGAARKADDYAVFEPALADLVGLAREVSACVGAPGAHPYDALLEEFERGVQVSDLVPLFDRLADELAAFVDAARGLPPAPEVDTPFPVDGQRVLFQRVAGQLGFDWEAGRLDISVHPFTCGLHPTDVRITTRYVENRLFAGLYAAIHEAGHGMYEQGLPTDLKGTGAGGAASMGLHESQSRFWENVIGGSLPFLTWLAGQVAEVFPGVSVSPEALYRARNRIQPTFNRVESDEATYNLHILIRFKLEVALLEGTLSTADLAGAWDDAYARYLGIRPPTALLGVLQDVHWSEGMFGYFPTYTLGNLYAASLGRRLLEDVPDLWTHVEQGRFDVPLQWMRTRVHQRASLATAAEIVRGAVGDRDPVDDLMDHLWNRHGALHGLHRPSR